MPATATSRLEGLTTSAAIKPPCVAVTSANITLSGLQTIGGVALAEGDRVLVRAQSSSVNNGIYNASTSDWTRAKDFNGSLDARKGTLVLVRTTAVDGAIYELTTADPVVFGTSAITFDLREDPAITYAQSQAEVDATVVPTSYAYTPADNAIGNTGRTGAAGDWNGSAGTDDTAALRAMCDVIQARGGGVLDLGSGRYRIYSDTGDTTPIGDFSNLRGVTIKSDGAEFAINREFASAVVLVLFKFTACTNIKIGDIKGTCTATRSEIYTRGGQLAQFEQGCSNIEIGNIDLTNWALGFNFYRLAADPQSYRSKNIRIASIKASTTGYPLVTTLSGDQLEAQITAESCGRSYFNYSARHHKISITSKNQDASADCLLYASDGEALSDIDLTYKNTETTNAGGGTRRGIYLAFRNGDTAAAVIRNIRLRVHIDQSTGFLTAGVVLEKLVEAGTTDPTDRGHKVENLHISGYIDTTSTPISLGDNTTWGAGETVSNFRADDLVLKTAQSAFYFFTSLKDVAVLQNITSASALNIVGNTTGKIVCLNVKAPNMTLADTDTSLCDYISCNITSGTTQAFTGKTFTNCVINGVKYHMTNALGIVSGITAPGAIAGFAQLYVDVADDVLKVKFPNSVVKSIATST